MGNWIEWFADGENDSCPVDKNMLIEVMMLDGEVWDDELAGDYCWATRDEAGEIIAYRIPEESQDSKLQKEKTPA